MLTCPNCGKNLNWKMAVQDPDNEIEPKNGDIVICYHCGEVYTYIDGELLSVQVEELPDYAQRDIKKALDVINAGHLLQHLREISDSMKNAS